MLTDSVGCLPRSVGGVYLTELPGIGEVVTEAVCEISSGERTLAH
jgi:hypothetical protein